MNQDTLSLICSPIDHEPLRLESQGGNQVLVGKDSGTVFPIRNGIPVLMDSSHLSDANEKSRRFYDLIAPFYEFTQSFYYRMKGGEEESRRQYLKYTGVKGGDRVLEVSIGNGVNIRFLPRDAEYYGIDVSMGQLRRCEANANKYGLKVEVFQAEAEHLPFLDGTFDVVFNVGSINYFDDKRRAIDEMFRVAKPGARMMMADETERSAHAHNKVPIYRGFFNSSKAPVVLPTEFLPHDACDVKLTEIRDGAYFCLQFRKSL